MQSLVRDPSSGIVPVALLDDDPHKARLHFSGVRVRGTRARPRRRRAKHEATTLVIAVPSATSETVRELSALARDCGLDVLVLPPVRELFGGRPTASDLRNLDVADLLGRQPVDLDMAAIADQIGGKRVLVTGAGGSIGSELCRQISRFGPSHLLMLDRDESGLHATQMSIEGRALLDSDDLLLCDIRDIDALRAAFERSRPEIVFHAAALKHLTMLERHPVGGVQDQRARHPQRARGRRGRRRRDLRQHLHRQGRPADLRARLVQARRRAAHRQLRRPRPTGRYISVRFGNVLGSRGSVVPAFMEQISRGGPVTVTHPDVERFFMLIPEACQLVLQAGAIGRGGEVMVLDMGSPVKIVDVARTLIDLSGRTDVEIVYTGLRPGEKLTEELFTPGEEIERSAHPLISQVYVPALDARHVDLHEGARRRRDPRVDAPPRERRALERRLMSGRIHLSKPDVTDARGARWSSRRCGPGWVAPLGPMVDRFEAEVAERVGVAGALALSSGTAALHLALLDARRRARAASSSSPTMTFAASANAVVYTGAEPVFVDADARDGNVDPDLLIEAVDTLRARGPRHRGRHDRRPVRSLRRPRRHRAGAGRARHPAASRTPPRPWAPRGTVGPRARSVERRPCRSTATRS